MQHRYTYTKGWLIFGYIASCIFILVGLAIGFLALQYKDQMVLMLVLAVCMAVFGSLCFAGITRAYLVIDGSAITYCNGFRTRKLLINQIKGFKFDGKFLHILPKQNTQKRIFIQDVRYFLGYEQIIQWLRYTLTDINLAEQQQEVSEIINDHRLGINDADRMRNLAAARRVVRVLNIGAFVLIASSVYAFPISQWLIVITFLYPATCFAVLFYYRGLVRFDGREKGMYPIVGMAILFSPLGLLIRSISDYSLYSYGRVWLITALLTAIYTVVIDKITGLEPRSTSKVSKICIMILFSVAFSYSGATVINCYYDESAPVVYRVAVIDQYILTGKVTTYELTLSTWGKKPAGENENVSKAVYQSVSKGDSVNVILKKGLLDIPWYYITR